MRIGLTSIYVDDQDKALAFYTDVVGLEQKADFTNGGYRWLTVAAGNNPDGAELQLASSDNPAGKAYQQALAAQSQPALMLYTDDIDADYARMKDKATFTSEPNDIGYAKIAMLSDGCGNLIQISQLKAWQ